jgi:lysylphosphatidylglycerol synthetase-like protein (DUF2156 family)
VQQRLCGLRLLLLLEGTLRQVARAKRRDGAPRELTFSLALAALVLALVLVMLLVLVLALALASGALLCALVVLVVALARRFWRNFLGACRRKSPRILRALSCRTVSEIMLHNSSRGFYYRGLSDASKRLVF